MDALPAFNLSAALLVSLVVAYIFSRYGRTSSARVLMMAGLALVLAWVGVTVAVMK